MIPKIIHCCWLSERPKNELAGRCLASWRRFAPGWECREWRLCDCVNPPAFFREAVRRKRWAFAADWVRFKALYDEGGVYCDLDFELVQPFDAESEFVAGQWLPGGAKGMEPAIIALEQGSPIAKAMLDYYETATFDGGTTVGEILATLDEARALKVLDPEVMSPIGIDGRIHRTERTIGIHWYEMSWASPRRRIARWLSWHGMRPLVELLLRLKR